MPTRTSKIQNRPTRASMPHECHSSELRVQLFAVAGAPVPACARRRCTYRFLPIIARELTMSRVFFAFSRAVFIALIIACALSVHLIQ